MNDNRRVKPNYPASNSPSEAKDGSGRAAGVLRTNHAVGTYSPEEVRIKFPVPGLKAYARVQGLIHFEWKRAEPIDEADARDAQCRAGWSDTGYDFMAFHFEGGIATWCCSRSCE